MAPFSQIIPPKKGRKESEVKTFEMPLALRTEEERRAEAIKIKQDARESERYAGLVRKPHPQESIVISDSTRKTMDDRAAQKAKVANVVTTHSDVAKVAAGAEVALVPTVDVYLEDQVLDTDNKMVVEDRTVTLAGVPQGETVLDRAESSLKQPKGDEYSANSATGPTLPEGVAMTTEGETTPAFSPDATPAERLEQRQKEGEAAEKASAAAEKKAAPKVAPKPKGK